MAPNASIRPERLPTLDDILPPAKVAIMSSPDDHGTKSLDPVSSQPTGLLTPEGSTVPENITAVPRLMHDTPPSSAKTQPALGTPLSSIQPPISTNTLTEGVSEEASDSSGSSSDETDDGDAKKREKTLKSWARITRQRVHVLERQSKSIFFRDRGIIYVTDTSWNDCAQGALNCHLYVASTALRTSPTMSVADLRSKLGGLPPRFRIVSTLLRDDMMKVSESTELNQDHMMPYRSIILQEAKYRQRLQDLESQFSNMSANNPSHGTVEVKPGVHYPLPSLLCYACLSNEQIAATLSDRASKPVKLDDMEKTKILLDGFRALIHFLDTDLRSLMDDYYAIKSNKVERLPFAHLWHLFTPGQEIFTKQPKHQVHRVLQVSGGRKRYQARDGKKKKIHQRTISDLVIDCFHVEFDGTEFEPVATVLRIKPYDGTRSITSLPVYPLVFSMPIGADTGNALATSDSTSNILTNRGRKYEGLSRPSHRRYNGLNIIEKGKFDTMEEIDGDVMIDFQLAYRNQIPNKTFGGGILETPTEEDPEEWNDGKSVHYDDPDTMRQYWRSWSSDHPLLQPQQPGYLHAECHILLPATVYGYALLNRKWYPLDVDLVCEVPERMPGVYDGFDRLVLPPGHKDIVRALVKTHARKPESIERPSLDRMPTSSLRDFDVVKGKGRGLIILLHGAPGVGKTSTAECVAANVGKPLFPITCGDIGGETAQEVEKNLDKYFDLARKWDCVLLLDEADVFLSTRDSGNIRQSSLVSVFLRVLEYYSGILILTTNRVGTFDEAIKSRVHCALYYPLLDKAQTFKIWQMNLKSLEERNSRLDQRLRIQFDHKEIEEFAKLQWKKGNSSNRWNGRQIKNAFQTAVALADWDNIEHQGPNGPILKQDHFKKVAEASEHFDQYLKNTRRSDQDQARDRETRNDGQITVDQSETDTESEPVRKSKKGSRSKNTDRKAKPAKRISTTRKSKRKEEASSDEDSERRRTDGESASDVSSDDLESDAELQAQPAKAVKKSAKKSERD